MKRTMMTQIRMKRLHARDFQTRLSYQHPRYKLQEQQQRAVDLEEKLRDCMKEKVKDARHRLAIQIERMNGVSPVRKLNQGFSYVEDQDGRVIKKVSQVRKDQKFRIHVTDGVIHASVDGVEKREKLI